MDDSEESGNENDENSKETGEDKPSEEKPSKFVYNCARCGRFCESQRAIPLTLQDIERWALDGTIHSLSQHMVLEVLQDGFPQMVLKKASDENAPEQKSGCPMYDEANKICNIHSSMPIHCASFPLGYSGEHYYIRDSECAGLSQGKMTDEWLSECRKRAKTDHEAKIQTNLVLPTVQGVFFAWMMETSRKAVENLSDEQKKQLEDVVGHNVVAGNPGTCCERGEPCGCSSDDDHACEKGTKGPDSTEDEKENGQ